MKLEGNTILITGGGRGIGFELAKQLAERGNTIIITGRDAQKLESAAKSLKGVHAVPGDVRRPEDITALHQRVTREFPALNVLVNNAGVARALNFNATDTLDDITHEVEVNVTAPLNITRAFLPHLKSKQDAALVYIGSGLAFVPLPIMPVYCATKAALHSFCQSLRVQLQPKGVKVFEVMPPTTQTDLLSGFDKNAFEGVAIMPVEEMVKQALAGIARDRYEIRPGQANQLRFMSRLAPDFILGQLSKSVAMFER